MIAQTSGSQNVPYLSVLFGCTSLFQVQTEDGYIYYWHCQSGLTQWEFPTYGLSIQPIAEPLSQQPIDNSDSKPDILNFKPKDSGVGIEDSIRFECELVDIQTIDSKTLIQGHCSELIEGCIQEFINKSNSGENILKHSVYLQVSRGIFRELDFVSNTVLKAFQINRIRAWGCCRDQPRQQCTHSI